MQKNDNCKQLIKRLQAISSYPSFQKQVKSIGFEAPRGGAYDNRKHLKLEAPCS